MSVKWTQTRRRRFVITGVLVLNQPLWLKPQLLFICVYSVEGNRAAVCSRCCLSTLPRRLIRTQRIQQCFSLPHRARLTYYWRYSRDIQVWRLISSLLGIILFILTPSASDTQSGVWSFTFVSGIVAISPAFSDLEGKTETEEKLMPLSSVDGPTIRALHLSTPTLSDTHKVLKRCVDSNGTTNT